MKYLVFGMKYLVFGMKYLVFGMAREQLDPCSIWGFPEAASSQLGLTDEMARKVFCHFHFHFPYICSEKMQLLSAGSGR